MKRRAASVVGVGLMLALAVAQGAVRAPAGADDAGPTVTAAPTTQLTDGQSVTITVRSGPPTQALQAKVLLCRTGVEYQGSTAFSPNADTVEDGPNCPRSPVSSSGDAVVIDSNIQANAASPEGETFLYRVGQGVAEWKDQSGNPQKLTCDETHTCSLVVELRYSPGQDGSGKQLGAVWKPFVFEVSYGNGNPLAACGAPPVDPVASGGGDRMSDAWIAWSLGACKRPDAHGAPTRASFIGEGNAVTQFATGVLDLAYTAGGYDADLAKGSTADSGLVKSDIAQRPSVAVPVALNAAVLAVGGGQIVGTKKMPYKTIQMTVPEMAALISSGLSEADKNVLLNRDAPGNAQLAQTGLFDSAVQSPIAGIADAQAFNWYASRLFKALAADKWKVADIPSAGDDRGRSRGVDANFGLADPPFTTAMPLLSGRPALIRDLFNATPNTSGGVWFLTDLDTASALSLTPVAVQDAAGTFVTPNAASLAAAVPNMKKDDQGILVSDPTVTTAHDGVQPYPTAFVEYALVPTEPLLNDDCTPRTDAQNTLTNWLNYITGDGQSVLPGGLAPLPADLKAQADAAIKKVGASAVTGRCADIARSDDTGSSSGATGSGSDASASSDTTATSPPPPAPAPAEAAAAAPVPAGSLPVSRVAQAVLAVTSHPAPVVNDTPSTGSSAVQTLAAIPRYLGRRLTSSWGTILGLLGIVALTMRAMMASARHR